MPPSGYDPQTGSYVDTRATRGIPMGGMGSGGFSFGTDGGFGEFRLNNNWMCPVRDVRGSFHAIFVRQDGRARVVVLRRTPEFPEYEGVRNVRSTIFSGALPFFTLRYDDDLPVHLALHGFTPHVPHDLASSTLPAAVFRFHVENPATAAVEVAILFSFENILGRGGTGHLGVDLRPDGAIAAVRGRRVYDSVEGNRQEEARVHGGRGIRFRTGQRHHPRAHRRSVTGEYLLLVDDGSARTRDAAPGPALEVTVCDDWDAAAPRATVLDDFARDGRLRSRDAGRNATAGARRPAAAVAAACTLAAGQACDVVFTLVWWTADHVTEPALAGAGSASPPRGSLPTSAPAAPAVQPAVPDGQAHAGADDRHDLRDDLPDHLDDDLHDDHHDDLHDGTRVGHVYETFFSGIDAVASHVLAKRERLARASAELQRLLADSTLPSWLVRALANGIDSTLANTVIPASGRLYTIEGVDWVWPFGGLTGTCDQRLAAHPYVATFFPELDLTELEEFARLVDARGAVPHGNGNCDLGLGTTEVPYGWPLVVKGLLPAAEWTDLTLSLVLQVARHWRVTGRRAILDRFWPVLVRGMDYIHGLAPAGVPEGGTTYDVWELPGAFVYSATLYQAALAAMMACAHAVDPDRIAAYRQRQAACAARLNDHLWDERGFFRTTPARDTIFTAALAGDWAARYLGLDPVVVPARAARHLQHQHRVLVTEAVRAATGRHRALPRAEATLEGAAVPHPLAAGLPAGEEMTYVWQVLSYQAMEQIYLGQVDAGLETMQTVYERIWHDGHAWSAGLRGNGESIYMTHPVVWAVLHALTGAALDVPGATLHLGPRVGGGMTRLRCPFFFPSLWARLDHEPRSGETEIEILRTFGEPVVVERVQHQPGTGPARVLALDPVRLTPGTRVRVTLGETPVAG